MNAQIPEWLKPFLWGAAAGAVVISIVGFSAGWVMTSGAAEKQAEQQKEKAVLAALTPVCVAQFMKQAREERQTELAALAKEEFWKRADFVEKQGWATMPGSKEPSDEVATACAAELMKLTKKTSE